MLIRLILLVCGTTKSEIQLDGIDRESVDMPMTYPKPVRATQIHHIDK